MKLTHVVCLLVWLLAGMPVLATGQTKGAPGQQGSQWQFGNFGKNAGGSVQIGESKITIHTQNTRHAFFESDFYSFVYQKQAFPYDDCSRSVVSVVIEPFSRGSAGIMMRSSDRLDASNAHLEVSSTGALILFYRRTDGTPTIYRRLGDVSFPLEIRLTRQGDMFMSHYKNAAGEWIKGPTAIAEVGDEPLIGFYGCSGDDSQIGYDVEGHRQTEVAFRDWKISYEENYIPAEKNFVDRAPLAEGTLLRENFADGSMSNKPATVGNPIWEGIKYAELPRQKDGTRYWHKRGDGIYFLGDKKWADYEVNIDLAFAKDSPQTSEFMLQARYQNIAIYDKMLKYYGISLRQGNKLFFEKYEAGGNTVAVLKEVAIPAYTDGAKHQLRVKFLDKHYEVWYDGKSVVWGMDEMRGITYGNISLKFTDVDMNLYKIEVLEVEDPVNGSADNYLLDYYDTPIPAYLEKYGYKIK